MMSADGRLPHQLARTVDILAPAEVVFGFLTDTARWATWWGAGSTIDPRAGGAVRIRYPNGVEVAGEVLAIDPPERLVFTYGYVSGTPLPVGASLVTLRLEPRGDTTRVHLTHAFAEASHRHQHEQGWRHQLSLFANAVSNHAFNGVAAAVDEWFTAWSIADDEASGLALRRIASPDVRMADAFSALSGIDDVVAHVAAARRFMPGLRLERQGEVHHCQGVVLADWVARNGAGEDQARGTNVFTFAPGGAIQSVTGFWRGRA